MKNAFVKANLSRFKYLYKQILQILIIIFTERVSQRLQCCNSNGAHKYFKLEKTLSMINIFINFVWRDDVHAIVINNIQIGLFADSIPTASIKFSVLYTLEIFRSIRLGVFLIT